ncbi:MAG TPA: helix-turn-helix domain-containing protein [Candidatus Tumulicola sp.]|nr:helix-turn-helix domain-containing protein [Candidatus Tumulicola sp.]
MVRKKTLEPQQARSKESQARLMRAAREILNEKGLEAATVPRVAARAGLSAGSVYRRFPDKDALIRSAVLDFVQRLEAANAAVLTPKLAKLGSLSDFAKMAVKTSLAAHRKNARMLRAIHQFILAHPDTAFKKKVVEVEVRSVQRVADFLLLKRKEIRHPHPAKAVTFALMLLGAALQEIVVLDVLPEMEDPRLPRNDDELARELTRVFLSYLGVSYRA